MTYLDYYIKHLLEIDKETLLKALYRLFDITYIDLNYKNTYQIKKNIDIEEELTIYIEKLRLLIVNCKNIDFVLNANNQLSNDAKFINKMYTKNEYLEFYQYLRLEEFIKTVGVSYDLLKIYNNNRGAI